MGQTTCSGHKISETCMTEDEQISYMCAGSIPGWSTSNPAPWALITEGSEDGSSPWFHAPKIETWMKPLGLDWFRSSQVNQCGVNHQMEDLFLFLHVFVSLSRILLSFSTSVFQINTTLELRGLHLVAPNRNKDEAWVLRLQKPNSHTQWNQRETSLCVLKAKSEAGLWGTATFNTLFRVLRTQNSWCAQGA